MLRTLAAWPSLGPVLFWAISLALFLTFGWDTVSAGTGLPWDAGWYASIAQGGYFFDGDYLTQQNIAFFPMYPALVAVVHHGTGMPVAHAELLTCAALTLAACVLVHRVLRHEFGEPVATMTVGLWIANPFAIYLFNGYSEAALVACVAAFFYFLLVRPRMHWAVVAVICASLVRPYGIFLALVFFLYALHAWRSGRAGAWLKVLLVHVPLTFTGYLAWAVYCDVRFADPLAPLHATEAWAVGMPMTLHGFLTLEAPVAALRRLVTSDTLLEPVAVGAILFYGGFLLFLAFSRRFSPLLALYGLVMPLLTLPVVGQHMGLYNSGRYEVPYFVHYAALALLLQAFDRRLVRPGDPAAEPDPSLPMAFYPVYVLFLSAFIRYTHYTFDGIWVS